MNSYIIDCYKKGVSCKTISKVLEKNICFVVNVILTYKKDNKLNDFYKLNHKDFIKKHGKFDFNSISKKVTFMNMPSKKEFDLSIRI